MASSSSKRARLDTTNADKEVWLLKVPQFVVQQWQSLPLLEERDRVHRPAIAGLVDMLSGVVRELARANKLTSDIAVNPEDHDQKTVTWKRATAARNDFLAALSSAAAAQGAEPPVDTAASDPLARFVIPLRRLLRTEVVLALAEAGHDPGSLAAEERTKSVGEKRAEAELLASKLPSAALLAQAALGSCCKKLQESAGMPAEKLELAVRVALEDEIKKVVPTAQVLDGSLGQRFRRVAATGPEAAAQLRLQQQQAAAQPQERVIGTLRTLVDPSAAGEAATTYALKIPGGLSNIPSDFLLSSAPSVAGQTAQVGFVVFGEGRADGGPPASVEATVSLKLDVNPRDPYDERYRAVSRARAARSSIRTREMKAMDVRDAPRMVPLPTRVNVTRKAADAAKAAKGIRAGEKRERTPKDGPNGLLARLFGLFEQRPHWRVVELEARTGEPLAWLKEVLQEIAELSNKGPTKGYYSLKAELQRKAAPKAEGGGAGWAAAAMDTS